MDDQSTAQTIPSDFSDAGGPAARQGMRYQDHVAISFLLEMIEDVNLSQVQCEMRDDITLVWLTAEGLQYEYIQVKATDGDSKYNIKEITGRKKNAKTNKTIEGTSLIEKSLLCDKGDGANPLFRFVTERGVSKALELFGLPPDERKDRPGGKELEANISGKFSKIRSRGDLDLAYWVENFWWQLPGEKKSVINSNKVKLTQLAEVEGVTLSASIVEEAYRDLLRMADDAAEASKHTELEQKKIRREAILLWWGDFISEARAGNIKTSKPYASEVEEFLIEFVRIDEEDILRALTGLEAQFEGDRWRTYELADSLVVGLLEIALKASEISDLTPSNARAKLKSAVRKILRHGSSLPFDQFAGDILLHVIMRQQLGSEPIACRVFEKGPDGEITFNNAHIVRKDSDQIWFGKSLLTNEYGYSQSVGDLLRTLSEHIHSSFMAHEKDLIVSLREPRHLRFGGVGDFLRGSAPISELLANACFPLLIAYDSEVIAGGNVDYKEKIETEAKLLYGQIKANLTQNLSGVRVVVYLVPVDSIDALVVRFETILRGIQ
ncbi:dsDNA nuclease domain-containing protein [Thalassospira alkalitolerans]|uniref:dsDNA nuclease domain-containing protein n=1 Tax=Thalassospira alkalitolerans TaxID=1293890 RepID=UPI003AA7E6F7